MTVIIKDRNHDNIAVIDTPVIDANFEQGADVRSGSAWIQIDPGTGALCGTFMLDAFDTGASVIADLTDELPDSPRKGLLAGFADEDADRIYVTGCAYDPEDFAAQMANAQACRDGMP